MEELGRGDTLAFYKAADGFAFNRTETLEQIASDTSAEFILLYTRPSEVKVGRFAIDRMLAVAADTGADMVYADHYDAVDSVSDDLSRLVKHPLIDCQKGALRDDFDFGGLLLFRTSSFKDALRKMEKKRRWGAMYELRLRMSKIVRINEYLYTEMLLDRRKSGEKQFDYVDPHNRDVQIEMEEICTDYLKSIGACLTGDYKHPSTDVQYDFPVTATVVIPVYNRKSTIEDAVRSALSQQCSFPFNVIVVDNHSTDGTSDILDRIAAEDSRLVHLIPSDNDLGIGGCWNLAIDNPSCGEYAVQLDSDDLYSGPDTLGKIVAAFSEQECAMVVGTYLMTDFNLNPIPPGVISHSEWTDDNGRNNALRINGLGAPRAFWTPLLRQYRFPNTSYGEDYAVGLRICREYRIGRIYDVLYHCRRWDGNSDAALDIEKVNANNLYKDRIRTWELEARLRMKL